jgi:hypothetical protein
MASIIKYLALKEGLIKALKILVVKIKISN